MAGDSPLVEGIKTAARAHQNLIWDGHRQMLRLRSALRDHFPAALEAFDDPIAAVPWTCWARPRTHSGQPGCHDHAQITALEGQVEAHSGRHPDAEIYRSQPGLGEILGARVLGEFGDDPDRYDGARARENYAGCLRTRTLHDETTARAHHQQDQPAAA